MAVKMMSSAVSGNVISIPEYAHRVALTRVAISTRLFNILYNRGCRDLGDLHGLTYKEVSLLRNCGAGTIKELARLVDCLNAHSELPAELEKGETRQLAKDNGVGAGWIHIPPAVRDVPLAHLPLSCRLAGVLSNLGFRRLGDLHGLVYEQMKGRKNCGRQTLKELAVLVRRAQDGEFNETGEGGEELDIFSLISAVNQVLSSLSPRNLDILLLRLGGTGAPPALLEEIGGKYDLTRERIRQILDKIFDRFRKEGGPRVNAILKRLAEKCLAEVCPLTPEALVGWLGPEATACRFPPAFYVRLLGELCAEIPVWPEGQRPGKHSARSAGIVRRVSACLRDDLSPQPLREVFTRLSAEEPSLRLAPGEFLDALSRCASPVVEVQQGDGPTMRPACPGTRDWARHVLSRSDRPLTPEDLLTRVRETFGEAVAATFPKVPRRVLKPEDGFFLLGPRALGLRQHFRLPEPSWSRVRSDCYDLFQKDQRPLLLSQVISRKSHDWMARTNAYEVAHILREDERFIDLGRLYFGLARWGISERQHVNDLIPKVLAEAGHPLRVAEVTRALRRWRSVSPHTVPCMLRAHRDVQGYGFGYFGLRAWGNAAKAFLVSDAAFVSQMIARPGPPLAFGDLCDLLQSPAEGDLAESLWRTVKSLPKVRVKPDARTPDTLLSHASWELRRTLHAILAKSDRPLRGHEILREVNERCRFACSASSLSGIETSLRKSGFAVQTPAGEYRLAERPDDDGIEADRIRQTCFEILAGTGEAVSAADLLERIKAAGAGAGELSAGTLATLLRPDSRFDEAGENLFRAQPS